MNKKFQTNQKGFPGSRFWRSSSSTPKNIGVSSKFTTGFTLIELLVVVSIISLLSGIVIASLSSVRSKARDTVRYSDVKQIKNALEIYFTTYGYYPTCSGTPDDMCTSVGVFGDLSTLAVVPTYIVAIKGDPLNLGTYGDFSASGYIKTGANTFAYTGNVTDYIFGMNLEHGSASNNYSGWGYTLNYLDGN